MPDTPPKIAFTAEPRTNDAGTLSLQYSVEDDYGVASANAEVVQPKPRGTEPSAARPLYGPPEIKLALPQGRSGEATTNLDLVEHPWAGSRVRMTLVARDEPGQEARSETLGNRAAGPRVSAAGRQGAGRAAPPPGA